MERDTTVEGSSSSKLPDVDPHLRIWAVDVSAWPKERAQKESIQALANELFAGKVEDTHRVTKYFQGIDRTREKSSKHTQRVHGFNRQLIRRSDSST